VPAQASSAPEQTAAWRWLQEPYLAYDEIMPLYNETTLEEPKAFLDYTVGGQWGVMRFDDASDVFAPYSDTGPAMICAYGHVHGLPMEVEASGDYPAITDQLYAMGFPFEAGGGHGYGDSMLYLYDPATGSMTLGFFGYGSFYTVQSVIDQGYDIEMPPASSLLEVISTDMLDEFDMAREDAAYLYGLATGDGQLLLPVEYLEIGLPMDGMIPLYQSGQWGYYNTETGALVDCIYDNLWVYGNSWWTGIGFYSEGLCPVRRNGRVGFIDKTGAVVVQPEFDGATHVYGGKAWVKQDGLWGQIEILG